MATQFFGERIRRPWNPRLLMGQALFDDDVHLPSTPHSAFVHTPCVHALIRGTDSSWALQEDSVVAIQTSEDLADGWHKGPLDVSPPPIEWLILHTRTHPFRFGTAELFRARSYTTCP